MKKLTLEVESLETEDIILALEEATKQLREGNHSGILTNEHNYGSWVIETID